MVNIHPTIYNNNDLNTDFNILITRHLANTLFIYNDNFEQYMLRTTKTGVDGILTCGTTFLREYRQDTLLKPPHASIFSLGIPVACLYPIDYRINYMNYVSSAIDAIRCFCIDRNITDIYYSADALGNIANLEFKDNLWTCENIGEISRQFLEMLDML
jgi:hypothetical protein